MENLRDQVRIRIFKAIDFVLENSQSMITSFQGYRPLRPETCGLVFMRAAMTSLATVHGTAFAYQTELGGKAALLSKFPVLTEDSFPRSKLIKVIKEMK